MPDLSPRWRFWLNLTACAAACLGLATAGHSSDKQKHPAQQQETASYRTSDPSLYAGSDACAACHDAEAKSYSHGPHWKNELNKGRGPQWQGCEACHGPGKAHVESGGDISKIISFKNLSSAEASRRCLDCHEFGEEHSNFMRSEHLKNDVGCIDCHSVHAPKVERRLLRAAQPELCYGCHLEVKPDFLRISFVPRPRKTRSALLAIRIKPGHLHSNTRRSKRKDA